MADPNEMPTRDERRTAAQNTVRLILDALEIEGRIRAVSGQKVVTRIDGVLVAITVSVPTWAPKTSERQQATCTSEETAHG